jgi:toxin CptA
MPSSLPAAHSAVLRLRLRPSRQLAWLLLAGHAAAVVLSWLAPVAWWVSLGLSLAVVTSLGFTVRNQALRSSAGALTALELRPDGSATVEDRQGRRSEVRILGSSFVSPVLTILNLAVAGLRVRRALVVAPDALAAEEFRRLRVWLRWRQAPADNHTAT